MKKNELAEIKKLDPKTLRERAIALKKEISGLILDKNMNTLKDLKTISKKRHDLAQTLTVLRQQELLNLLKTNEEGGKQE